MMKKTPKKPATKKTKGGRPPKVHGQKRTRVVLWLPEDLAAELDRKKAELAVAGHPLASRGDVVADALRRAFSRSRRSHLT
jgi:metal-responsive CopG/Arc/MetJ family transcriptional regulator